MGMGSPRLGEGWGCLLPGVVDWESEWGGVQAPLPHNRFPFHHLFDGKNTGAWSACSFIQHVRAQYVLGQASWQGSPGEAPSPVRHPDQGLHVGSSRDRENLCVWERTDRGTLPDCG